MISYRGLRRDWAGFVHTFPPKDAYVVTAAILAEPDAHRGQIYPLSASVELTLSEIAAIIGSSLGRTVRYEKLPAEQWARKIGMRRSWFSALEKSRSTKTNAYLQALELLPLASARGSSSSLSFR